jgi:hypothetical protein
VRLSALIALGCLCLSSCGSGDSIGRTYPVKGKVTVNGEPLKLGTLTFWPNAAKGSKSSPEAAGQIAEDGSYELYTKGKAGALLGSYKVTVVAQTIPDSTTPEKAKLLVPEKYTNRETTPLVIEVVASPEAGAYDLILK